MSNDTKGPEADTGASSKQQVIAPSGWTTTGQLTAVQYGTPGGFPDHNTPGPKHRGKNDFEGGNAARSTATQTISFTSRSRAAIRSGTVRYTFSAWLGGFENQHDNAAVSVKFLSASGQSLGSATLGPVTPLQRHQVTALLHRLQSGIVPKRAAKAVVTLVLTRVEGNYNDGSADNISLVLSRPAAPAPSHPVSWLYPSAGALSAAVQAGFTGRPPQIKYTHAFFQPQGGDLNAGASIIPPLECAFHMGAQANQSLENQPALAQIESKCAGHVYVQLTYFIPTKVDANGHLIPPDHPALPMAFDFNGTLVRPDTIIKDPHPVATSMEPGPSAPKEPAYRYTDRLVFSPPSPWSSPVDVLVVNGGNRKVIQVKRWQQEIIANAAKHEAALQH